MPQSTSPLDEQIAIAREAVATPKHWNGGRFIPWRDAAGKPKGLEFRAALTVDAVQPQGLFVSGYFKPTAIPGIRDKLSFSLVYGGRVFGVDDNGPSRHRNDVGAGRPLYGQIVDHPQIHTISDDGIEGYAEPLPIMPAPDLWALFITEARILGAPEFTLPEVQREFPL